jgi:hypothetical protein
MSDDEYVQWVPSGPLPFAVGSAPVLFPMYFWHGTISLPVSRRS